MTQEASVSRKQTLRLLRPFFVWLGAFYLGWLLLVLLNDEVATVMAHWPIAFAMSFGSYFAGSTPMGGGTVGFPVLVLLFGQPASFGRDFSFAVQSIGMTSAAIYILATRQPVAGRLLLSAIAGSAVGTPLGLLFIAPYIPSAAAKLLFAVVWASFAVLTLSRLRVMANLTGMIEASPRVEMITGALTGLLGGALVASVTGVGIDMLIYVVLVLARRADLRIAIPTSVILMAATSLIGIAFQGLLLDSIQPGVWGNWLAAAPIVALGAPLGALIVTKVGRAPTLVIVSVLCLGQFAWAFMQEIEHIGWWGGAAAVLGVLIAQRMFEVLSRWGDRLAGTSYEAPGSIPAAAPLAPADLP